MEELSISSGSCEQSGLGSNHCEDAYIERACASLTGPPLATSVKRGFRIMLVIVLVTSLILGIVHHHELSTFFEERFLVSVQKLGLWAAAVLLLVTASLNIFMLPTFPLMFGAGVVFMRMYESVVIASLIGTVSVFLGLWLGSMCAFQLGRTLWKDFAGSQVNNTENETFKVINSMIDEQGLYIVLLARMSPLLPAEVFNYACALTKLSLFQYGLGCLGSIVPVTIWVVTAAVTTRATHIHTKQSAGNATIITAVNILILIALTTILYRSYRKSKTRLRNNSLPGDTETFFPMGPNVNPFLYNSIVLHPETKFEHLYQAISGGTKTDTQYLEISDDFGMAVMLKKVAVALTLT